MRATKSAAKAAATFASAKHQRTKFAIIFVPSAPFVWVDATRAVPFVHRIEPLTEAAFRHGHFNYVREIPLDCLRV